MNIKTIIIIIISSIGLSFATCLIPITDPMCGSEYGLPFGIFIPVCSGSSLFIKTGEAMKCMTRGFDILHLVYDTIIIGCLIFYVNHK